MVEVEMVGVENVTEIMNFLIRAIQSPNSKEQI